VFHIVHKNPSTPIQLHTPKIWNSKKYTQFKMNSFVFFCLITSFICSKIRNSLVWSLTHCLVTSHMRIGWMNFLIDEFFSMAMRNLKKWKWKPKKSKIKLKNLPCGRFGLVPNMFFMFVKSQKKRGPNWTPPLPFNLSLLQALQTSKLDPTLGGSKVSSSPLVMVV